MRSFRFSYAASAFVFLALLTSSNALAGKLRVLTTTPSFADIVRQIGGDHVKVSSVMRGPENIHHVKAKPSTMIKLRKADLFMHTGLDAEPWAPQLMTGSRKQKFLPGQSGVVDLSHNIVLREVPKQSQLTRALGDIHAYGNPHYSLDPLNGIIIARTITDALSKADPEHAQEFEANYTIFADSMRELTRRLQAKLAPYQNTPIAVYHRAWPYFLARFPLDDVAEVEPKPGISPGPKHLKQCVQTMKSHDARIVFVETFNSKKNAQSVAKRVDGKAIVMALEVNALPDIHTYQDLFEYDVNAIVSAFKEVGVQPHGSSSEASDAANASADNPADPTTP